MEKLLNYLNSIRNFYFENLSNSDFYNLSNKYYIYKKLVNKNQLEEILNNNPNYTLISDFEFKKIRKYRLNKLTEILKKFEKELYIYLSKPVISKKDTNNFKDFINDTNVILVTDTNGSKFFTTKTDYPLIDKGLILLREKRSITKSEDKNFKSLENLSNNQNIGLYVKKTDNTIKIICYDYSKIHDFFINDTNFIFPILFAGQIYNKIDTKKRKIPYDGAIIIWTVARKDVSGRSILYPLLASYANNNILISDRHTLTKFSKKVWDKFYDNHDIFDRKFPIDDLKKPITIDDNSDDGILFNHDKYKDIPYDIEKIKSMSSKEQKEELSRIRLNDPYNWAYQLNSSVKSEANKIKNILIKNHEEITKEHGNINEKLEELADDFFEKQSV